MQMKTADPSNYVFGQTLRVRGPISDSVLVDLFYQDTLISRNNAGNLVLSWRYRANSVFDPDPLLGTGSLSGFNEWAAFFNAYRVVDFDYDIQFSNLESFPLICVACPTLLDVGANYASTDQMPEFPYGKKSMISGKGGMDRARIRGHVDLASLEGATTYFTSNEFAAVVTTNPGTVRFMNFGIVSTSVLVNGILASVRMKYKTLFFRRSNIPS
jgi:hypothetical protein